MNSAWQARHQDVCKRVQANRRVPFDSKKQRTLPMPEDYRGPPLDSRPPRPPPERRPVKQFDVNAKPRPTRSHINRKPVERVPSHSCSADEVVLANRVPVRSMHYNKREMIECPHCLRRFQEGSADRHIRFCEEIHTRVPLYKDNWQARFKLAMRTQYRAPLPNTRYRQRSDDRRSTRTPAHALEHCQSRTFRNTGRNPVVDDGVSHLPGMPLQQYSRPHQLARVNHSKSLRPPRSRMVTYGAVQPFSRPAVPVSKDGLCRQQTRFGALTGPKRILRLDFDDQDQFCGTVAMQHPDTISAQMQTDSFHLPVQSHGMRVPHSMNLDPAMLSQYNPWYLNSVDKPMYPGLLLPSGWLHVPPWYMSDDNLKIGSRVSKWSTYPVLPDVGASVPMRIPQQSHYNFPPAYQLPSDSYQRDPLMNTGRFLLRRDDTVINSRDLLLGRSGAHSRYGRMTGSYCGNCGAAHPTGYGNHYCSGCGMPF